MFHHLPTTLRTAGTTLEFFEGHPTRQMLWLGERRGCNSASVGLSEWLDDDVGVNECETWVLLTSRLIFEYEHHALDC